MGRSNWTAEEVRALGVHTTVPIAGEIFGAGSTKAYELVHKGEFPVPVLRLGHRLVVPVEPILELLRLGDRSVPPH